MKTLRPSLGMLACCTLTLVPAAALAQTAASPAPAANPTAPPAAAAPAAPAPQAPAPAAPAPAAASAAQPSAETAAPSTSAPTTAAPFSGAAPEATTAAASSTPPTPSAPIDEPRPSVPAPPTPLLDAWLGVHGLVVPSPAYDAFSENDALTSFTAGAGLSLVRSGSTHVAAVASISTGGAEASYRQAPTELSILRLTLGPELRFPFAGRFYAYGRLSPQLVQTSASLGDASAQADLEEEEWLFGVDGALGVSGRIAEIPADGLSSPLCFFARAEAGYTWTPASELELAPGSGAPIRSEPVSLGDLSLSGISFRGALGVGY